MTAAELVVLGVVAVLVIWLLRPLQRAVRNVVERLLLRRRHGQVIEGHFRPADGSNDDPDSPRRPH